MKLVIERETWLRGEGDDNSYLLRKEDGKKCCLGFFALQCGLTPEQITNMRGRMSLVKAGIPLPGPDKVFTFINRFDLGEKVKPFSFSIPNLERIMQ